MNELAAGASGCRGPRLRDMACDFPSIFAQPSYTAMRRAAILGSAAGLQPPPTDTSTHSHSLFYPAPPEAGLITYFVPGWLMRLRVSSKAMAEFKSHDDYWKFSRSVIGRARYVFEPHTEEFLSTVIGTVRERVATIAPDSVLLRAQLGFEWRPSKVDPADPNSETVELEEAFRERRMKPLRESAREGRMNAKGIPCLYLSDDRDTAMAETRPWMGSLVSLGHFIVLRQLRLVNCCEPRHRFHHVPTPHFEPVQREKIAWGELSYAFSEPATPTDMTAEYAPTQVLSDLFRHHGYDGIRYRSLLGPGYNYALFDLDAADLHSCQLHIVKNIRFNFEAHGTAYMTMKYYRPPSSASTIDAESSAGPN